MPFLDDNITLDHEAPGNGQAPSVPLTPDGRMIVDVPGPGKLPVTSAAAPVTEGEQKDWAEAAPTGGHDSHASAGPIGGTFLPDDIKLDEPQPKPMTAMQSLGAGTREVLEGAGSVLDLPGDVTRAGLHAVGVDVAPFSIAKAIPDALGLPEPQTDSEKVVGSVVRGAAGALPFIASGGVAAAAPVAQMVSGGAAGGVGEKMKQAGYGPLAQMGGSLLAGGLAGGATAVAGGYRPTGGVSAKVAPYIEPSDGVKVYDAADRLGMADKLLPADVGGPFVRRMTATAAQTPLGAGPVIRAAKASTQAVKGAAGQKAASAGTVLDAEDAGDLVHKGVKLYAKDTSRRGGVLYTRAETLAGKGKVDPKMARTALAEHIAELSETPETNAGPLKVLGGLQNDLSKPLSIGAIRRLRTNTRAAIMKEGLRGTDVERRVGDVLDNASADIVAGIPKEAAAAYKTADSFWKNRVEQIDDIIAPIVGKKGEKGSTQAFEAIERLARRGDSKKLSRLMASLPEEDAGSITATMIDRLGAATPGAQDAIGGEFSPSTFLTNWNKLSPKAKTVLFKPELRASLDDLATVTGGMKAASKYANAPNTGGVVAGLASMSAATELISHPILSGSFLSAQYVTGRLMSSPAFVRRLVKIGRAKSDGALRTQIKGLNDVANDEPAIRDGVVKFQTALNAALGARAANAANDAGSIGGLTTPLGVSAAASPGDTKEDKQK